MPFYLPMATNGAALHRNTLHYSMDMRPVWLLMGNILMLLTRKIWKESAAVKLLQVLFVHKYGKN